MLVILPLFDPETTLVVDNHLDKQTDPDWHVQRRGRAKAHGPEGGHGRHQAIWKATNLKLDKVWNVIITSN